MSEAALEPARDYVLVLNGPNLNLLGTREPGRLRAARPSPRSSQTWTHWRATRILHCGIGHVQSNHEGVLVDAIQKLGPGAIGIIINPGGAHPLQHRPARCTGRSRHSRPSRFICPISTPARSSATIPWSPRSSSARSPVSVRTAIGLALRIPDRASRRTRRRNDERSPRVALREAAAAAGRRRRDRHAPGQPALLLRFPDGDHAPDESSGSSSSRQESAILFTSPTNSRGPRARSAHR